MNFTITFDTKSRKSHLEVMDYPEADRKAHGPFLAAAAESARRAFFESMADQLRAHEEGK